MSITLGDALVYLAAEHNRLRSDLEAAGKETNSWVNRVADGIAIGLGEAIVGAVGRGIQAVGSLGRNVFQFSLDSQRAVGNLQSEIGATAEEAELLGQIAERVFANNFGDNLLDAAHTVGLVRQQIHSLNAEGIQGTAEFAHAIRDTYGGDIPRTIDATRTLMEDFNLTWQEASDFIAAGFQRGLNRSGDFLESITEYSTQFRSAGADAGQFFSIMETGLQGGMLGTDRVADMFKEFRVRLLDGSETTRKGLEQIGLSIEEITAGINGGTLTWTDVFEQVTGRLRQADDQAVQMQAGVALLGTQFEDMGVQAALGVDLAATSLAELDGAAVSLNARYNNLSDLVAGFGRKLTVALSPATDALLEMANEAAPELNTMFNTITANAGTFAVGLVGIFRAGLSLIRSFLRGLRGNSENEMGQTAESAGSWGRNIVLQLARGMAAAATAVVQVLNQIGQLIAHWLKPHSPPALLPDIDDWGKGLIEAWLSGADQADMSSLHQVGDTIMGILGSFGTGESFSLFEQLSSTVEQMFRSLPSADDDETLIGRILGSRAAIAAAIAELEDTGQVGQTTFDLLAESMQGLPDFAMDYVHALLEVASANQAVEDAQEHLNQVTEEYENRLKPLNDELKGIRNRRTDMADEKRLAELRRAMARGALSDQDKELALMEIREIELQKSIRATEAERDTAVEAAQTELEAAQERQRLAEEQLAVQQGLIQAQQQGNALLQQQMDLLAQLAQEMEGMATGLADAVSEGLGDALAGTAFGEGFDPLDGLGDGLTDGLADELTSGLDDAFAELDVEGLIGDIMGEFDPLGDELEGLGETFGVLGEAIGPLSSFFDTATEKGRTFREILKGIGIVLGTAAIAPTLATIVSWLISMGAAIVGLAGSGSLMTTLGAVIGTAIAALGGPLAVIIGLITALGLAWSTNFLGIRDETQYVIAFLKNLFNDLTVYLSETFGPAVRAGFQAFQALFEGDFTTFGAKIQEYWRLAWDAVTNLLGDLWGWVEPKLIGWYDSLTTWFTDTDWKALAILLLASLILGLADFWLTAETTINGWYDSFSTWFETMDWYGLGFKVVTFILEALMTFWTTVLPTVTGWYKSFTTWFTETDWETLAVNLITRLVDKLGTFWSIAESTVEGWWEAIKNWFEGVNWSSLADGVVDGIVAGLANGASAVVGALADLASGMMAAWEEFWDSHSPSRRMMRSAGDIVEGAVVGAQDKAQEASAAMQDVAQELFAPVAGIQASVPAFAAPVTPPAIQTFYLTFGDIHLADKSAVEAFTDWIRGLNQDTVLQGFAL